MRLGWGKKVRLSASEYWDILRQAGLPDDILAALEAAPVPDGWQHKTSSNCPIYSTSGFIAAIKHGALIDTAVESAIGYVYLDPGTRIEVTP